MERTIAISRDMPIAAANAQGRRAVHRRIATFFGAHWLREVADMIK